MCLNSPMQKKIAEKRKRNYGLMGRRTGDDKDFSSTFQSTTSENVLQKKYFLKSYATVSLAMKGIGAFI